MYDRRSRTTGLLLGLLLLALAAALVSIVAFLIGVRVVLATGQRWSSADWFFGVILPLFALVVLAIPGGLLVRWSSRPGRYRVPPAMARLDRLMGRMPVNPRYGPGRVAAVDVDGQAVPGRPPVRRSERRLPWQQ